MIVYTLKRTKMSFFFTYGHPTALGWLIINSCNIVKFAFFSLDIWKYSKIKLELSLLQQNALT